MGRVGRGRALPAVQGSSCGGLREEKAVIDKGLNSVWDTWSLRSLGTPGQRYPGKAGHRKQRGDRRSRSGLQTLTRQDRGTVEGASGYLGQPFTGVAKVTTVFISWAPGA